MISVGIAAPILLALAVPSSLFGSAPTDREWHAEASAIRVVDGETIGLGDKVVRLAGVAAPARGEDCHRATGEVFDCGGAAAAALMRLIGQRAVTCRIVGQDGFGRGLGQCRTGSADINKTLVRQGFAIASSGALRSEEGAARLSSDGLWANAAGAPATWRLRN